jgi:hypothetical protein
LCAFLNRTIPSLIARAIERIAMRRVPHPVTRGSRGRPRTKERLSRRRRRRRRGVTAATLVGLACVFEVTVAAGWTPRI